MAVTLPPDKGEGTLGWRDVSPRRLKCRGPCGSVRAWVGTAHQGPIMMHRQRHRAAQQATYAVCGNGWCQKLPGWRLAKLKERKPWTSLRARNDRAPRGGLTRSPDPRPATLVARLLARAFGALLGASPRASVEGRVAWPAHAGHTRGLACTWQPCSTLQGTALCNCAQLPLGPAPRMHTRHSSAAAVAAAHTVPALQQGCC